MSPTRLAAPSLNAQSLPRPHGAILAAVAVLAVLLLLTGCAGSAVNPSQGEGGGSAAVTEWDTQQRGEPISLRGTDMDGEPVDTTQWRGEVVVLNVWYANCPPCRKEAPDLQELSQTFAEEAHFLGLNKTDTAEQANAFAQTFGLTYPTLNDRDATAIASLQSFVPLAAVPSTLVLDRQGRAAARILGLADRSTLETLIKGVLAEPT